MALAGKQQKIWRHAVAPPRISQLLPNRKLCNDFVEESDESYCSNNPEFPNLWCTSSIVDCKTTGLSQQSKSHVIAPFPTVQSVISLKSVNNWTRGHWVITSQTFLREMETDPNPKWHQECWQKLTTCLQNGNLAWCSARMVSKKELRAEAYCCVN